MGKIIMRQPTKRELTKLKKEAAQSSAWEETESFKASKPTSIRLSPQLIKDLEKIARLRGERSYQTLLKRWVSERVEYEIELIDLAKHKKAG
jgi:hypothetical protein